MWRVGLVGTGYWSEKHLKAWQLIANVEVVALCNRSVEKLLQRGEQFGIAKDHLYTNLEEMLRDEAVDIVDIVTGPETHLSLVKIAAKAGKHILCQKPFAPTYTIAKEMVKTADDAGVRLMITENWRWLQPFQMIKSVLQSRELGDLRVFKYFHTDYYTPRMAPERQIPQPFFRTMPRLLFYEMGAHWFDTWRFLFGEPKRLYAEMKKVSPYVQGEDTGTIIFGYDDYYGYLDASWASREKLQTSVGKKVEPNHQEQMTVEGGKATLKLFTSGKISITHSSGNEEVIAKTTTLDHEESHFRLQSHFINCLDSGDPFQTSGADNLKTMNLMFRAYESASEKKVIHL